MRITRCIECDEYKYIENNGLCRSCISELDLVIGKDKDGNENKIKDNALYSGLNIIGVTGSGKTTMAIKLISQLQDRNYGVCYFDSVRCVNKATFGLQNANVIDFQYQDGFNILNVERDSTDKYYHDEINKTTDIITKIIKTNSNKSIDYNDVTLLKQLIKSILYLKKEHTINYLYECLIDLEERKNVLNHTSFKINSSNINIHNEELAFDGGILSTLHRIINNKQLMKRISKKNYTMDSKNIIKNSKTLIVKQNTGLSDSTRKILNSIISEKVYSEIKIQNTQNNKFVFCYDDIDKLNNIRRILYSSGEKYDIGTINITSDISNKTVKSDNILSFKLSNKLNINKMCNSLLLNRNEVKNLTNFNYVAQINDSIYKGKLDI